MEEQTEERILTEETATTEYIDVVKNEYMIERNKKQSFENRAGIILALLGTICIFLFEKIKLKDILLLIQGTLTGIGFIKIVCGVLVYFGFVFTLSKILQTIMVNAHDNFNVTAIDESLLAEERLVGICRIIRTYSDIIVQHRKLNEKRADALRKSLYGICVTIFSAAIYINL